MAAAEGAADRALRLAGFAGTRREVLGTPLSPAEAERVTRLITPAVELLTPEAAERARSEGRELALADQLDAALGRRSPAAGR